ncbi:glycosyl hydrolase family 18 protein [Corallococcus carmarthensis]|uniref:glycosyl hydrolase family 18 protein n=1 Tax=Corallococcus carmarthensis TaxID=2316728 RepID=UPI00148BF78F|nr:glycosyl hydrolase family 18 protein [Corallococcus carmarthensis]NOK16108.1 chitinase [Corallococcus carmarthensis]
MRRQLIGFLVALGAMHTGCGGAPDFTSTAGDEDSLATTGDALASATTMYDDALGSGWQDWSWATHSLTATKPVYAGTRSISATFGPWKGLYFHHAGVPTTGYGFVELQVNPGATANPAIALYASVGGVAKSPVALNSTCAGGTLKANAWTLCRMPLATLGAANATLDGLVVMENAGRTLPVMYFDNVRLAASTTAPSAPTALKATGSATDVALTWGTVTGATGYHVYRATSQTGTYARLTSTALTAASYKDTSAVVDTTYWYAVTALNAAGESAKSSAVSGKRTPSTGVSVSVTPTTATLSLGGVQTFTALVTGSSNTAVTWSVLEGATGGTVTSSGTYTAPRTAGTYHVVATSSADATKKATADVVVTGPVGTTNKWVSGYYTGWNADDYPPEKVDFSALTHIIVGRVTPNTDGTVDAIFDNSNGSAIAKTLSTRAHAAGRKAIIMVGGAGEHENWVGAATSANREKFVQNLLKTMDDHGYDGLDIDWEPVEEVDKPNLLALVQRLRQARPNMLLTFPIGWVNNNFSTDASLKWYPQLAQYLDQVNVMSYEMIGVWGGWDSWFTSALKGESGTHPTSVESSLNAWVSAGIPKQKLGMGIPFYGLAWRHITGPRQPFTDWSDYVGGDNSFTYKKILALSKTGTLQWDAAAQANYVTFSTPVEDGTVRWITYDGPEAIQAKGQYAKANGYGGTIIWTINQGCTDPATGANPLLTEVKKAFLQ